MPTVNVDLEDPDMQRRLKQANIRWKMSDLTAGFVKVDAAVAKEHGLTKEAIAKSERDSEKHLKAVAKDEKVAEKTVDANAEAAAKAAATLAAEKAKVDAKAAADLKAQRK